MMLLKLKGCETLGEVVYIKDILRLMDGKKKVVTFRCNPIVLDFLKERSVEKNVSLSSLVNDILTEYYEDKTGLWKY